MPGSDEKCFSNFSANVMFNGTTVLRRRFDPEDALATIERALLPVALFREMRGGTGA